MMDFLNAYPDVIANSFEDVPQSNVEVRHKFELTTNQSIFQKLRRIAPADNEVIKEEVDCILEASIIAGTESS